MTRKNAFVLHTRSWSYPMRERERELTHEGSHRLILINFGKKLDPSLITYGSVPSAMTDNRDENNEGSSSTQQHLNTLTTQNMSPEAPKSTSAALPGGESGYEPWYPANIPVDSSVKRFITHFFEVSDDADRNDEWLGFFQDDATVMMGNDVAKGKEGESFFTVEM
jgi:hypothetical protein